MRDQLRLLQIIHLALCSGLVLGYVILGNLFSSKVFIIPEIDTAALFYLFIPLLAYILSNYLFKSLVSKIDKKQDMNEKIVQYQSASIVRWAIIEGAAFIILFLKPDFIIFGLVLIVYLFFLRPTEEKINNDLNNLTL